MSVTLIPNMNIEGTSGFYNTVECQALVTLDTKYKLLILLSRNLVRQF